MVFEKVGNYYDRMQHEKEETHVTKGLEHVFMILCTPPSLSSSSVNVFQAGAVYDYLKKKKNLGLDCS